MGFPVYIIIIRLDCMLNLRGYNLLSLLLKAKFDLFGGQIAIKIEAIDKLLLVRYNLAYRNILGVSYSEYMKVGDSFKLREF